MIYQFPEFVSQYNDRYPYSVKSDFKKHLNHLKVENIWKTQFSQQKSGLSNYTIYSYSKNNISSSFIKPHCHLKKILLLTDTFQMRLSRMRVPLFGSSWKLGELIDQTYISINNF